MFKHDHLYNFLAEGRIVLSGADYRTLERDIIGGITTEEYRIVRRKAIKHYNGKIDLDYDLSKVFQSI